MESTKQSVSLENDHYIKVIKMIETIVKRCVSPKFKISNPNYYLVSTKTGLERFQKSCFPMGLADERIVDYITYQLYRYRDILMSSRWSVTWVFTPAAINKYRQQFLESTGKAGMRYYIKDWLEDGDLNVGELVSMIMPPSAHPMRKYLYMPSEEYIKKRWLNTEEGLILCINSTTGWSPMSPTCQQCNNSGKCIEFTKQNYPELIRLRKESQNA